MRARSSIATPQTWPARLCRACWAGPPRNNGAQGSRMVNTFRAACELKRNLRTALFAAVLMTCATAVSFAQEHAAEGAHDESIGGMILGMGWPVANFIVFVGILYYFFNQPLKDYLASRSTTIRKELV